MSKTTKEGKKAKKTPEELKRLRLKRRRANDREWQRLIKEGIVHIQYIQPVVIPEPVKKSRKK
jgi:hypothetical protein